MATSSHLEQTTSDGSSVGRAPTSGKSTKTDREVATLARQIRSESNTGDERRTLNDWIAKLKAEQAAQRAERKRIAADLKNTVRRKRRLQSRARQLTNADLMEVLLMRDGGKLAEAAEAGENPEAADGKDDTAAAPMEEPSEKEKPGKTNSSDDEAPQSSPGAASSSGQR